MAIPTIKLNLVPQKPFLQTYHLFIGWFALAIGVLTLVWSIMLTVKTYRKTIKYERQIGRLSSGSISADAIDAGNIADLQNLDIPKELPKWQLAERVGAERNAPWSRIIEEIECIVPNVHINSILRNSFSGKGIKIEVTGEASSRKAEVAFMESLEKNNFFKQIVLEKESESQEGGVLFAINITI